jgi:hypothetical protein
MKSIIERVLRERRSLNEALADLLAKHEREPTPELARAIDLLRDEMRRKEQQARDDQPAPKPRSATD